MTTHHEHEATEARLMACEMRLNLLDATKADKSDPIPGLTPTLRDIATRLTAIEQVAKAQAIANSRVEDKVDMILTLIEGAPDSPE